MNEFDSRYAFSFYVSSKGPLVLRFTFSDYVALIVFLFGVACYLSHGTFWSKPDPYLYKLFERPQEQFSTTSKVERSRDIARQLREQDKDAVIFWGSQSGTAERYAHRLARDCVQRFNLDVLVGDLSDYDHETISSISKSKFAIFVVSTYGEGDPSDNAAEFMEWLQKRSGSLTNLRYAAFGLGNSNYVYYNKVVEDVVSRLEELSAISLLPLGKADDADNTSEEDFISWREELFGMFHSTLQLKEHIPHYEPSIEVVDVTRHLETQLQRGEPIPLKLSRKAARDYSAIKQLPIKDLRTLAFDDCTDKKCLHMEVDLRDSPQIKYKTGDHLAVWPNNPPAEVEKMLAILGLMDKKDAHISVSSFSLDSERLKIPKYSTISALFQHYLEICAPVSRDTAYGLCQLAPSESTKRFLQGLSHKTNYTAFTARNHVTFARLLEHTLQHDASATWSHLPLSFVIESLRPMTPRYYSISSSSMTSSRKMSITVAVSSTELASDPPVKIAGLATSYLNSINDVASAGMYAHVRRSNFKMPFLHKTPIILVAAGTGIAPFRAFLQERAQMAQISNQEIGLVVLVFGCRHPDQDYLYRSEIEAIQKGPLKGKLEVITAFSRLPSQKKCYVQDRLAEVEIKSGITQMLCENEATLYFCGSTAMAKAAGKVITSAVQEYQKQNDAEIKAWADGMKRSRRWQEDVWG